MVLHLRLTFFSAQISYWAAPPPLPPSLLFQYHYRNPYSLIAVNTGSCLDSVHYKRLEDQGGTLSVALLIFHLERIYTTGIVGR